MMQNKLKKEFTRTAGSRRSVTGRLLFLSMLLFTFLGGARAQETLTVCDGTETNEFVPFYGYYADATQQNQMIYPATELTSMVGKEITQMVFYIDHISGDGDIGNWIVSLGETSATTLDGIDNTTPLTEVYSGPMTFNSDETLMTVTFDADYVYNGGNLLVEFNHPVEYEWKYYFFLGVEATGASYCYSDQRNFLPKVTFSYETPSSCPKPSALAATTDGSDVTLTWTSNATSFDVVYSTDATANPNNLTPVQVTDNTYTVTGLALGDYYFWVRANCSDTEHSKWAGPKQVNIGYCRPAPTSVDGYGISNVTFGMGDNVVNNDTPKAVYADYSNQIGALPTGIESTVAITYDTGYTYGTIIWVDWNNSMSFEDNEIVYTGTSESTRPFTLNATFTIPATQAPGDYRMRIGGADSAFNGFIEGTSTTAPNPCYSSDYACFQDYTLRVIEAPSWLITGLTVNYTDDTTAEVSWNSSATSFDVVQYTDAAANPDELTPTTVSTNSYTLTDPAMGDHYIWVRANLSETEHSNWIGPLSICFRYCRPAPTSVDGYGISNVTFGMGDNVVNNDTPKAVYADYSNQIGALPAGIESTVAITYDTGYTYGTIIWVDFDNSMSFENNEIIYTGTSESTSPFTLNATITIPATQAPGDYRMRIGGADNAFDNFISGYTTAEHSPCYASDYACFQDYTLRVIEAPSCLPPTGVTVNYTGGTTAEVSWTSDAEAWNIDVNGDVIHVTDNSYTLEGLDLATTYVVKVQADCGNDDTSFWINAGSFTTDICEPENQCTISYTLGVSNSQNSSWYGATIKVVHHDTGKVVGELAYSQNAANTGELNVCYGETYDIVFENPQNYPYATFTLWDAVGDVIADETQAYQSGTGTSIKIAEYTVNCNACKRPKDLSVSELTQTSATVTWEAGSNETQWAVSYRDVDGEGEEILNLDFAGQTASLPEGSMVYNVYQGFTSPVDDWNVENGALTSVTNGSILFIPVQLGGKAQVTVSGNNSNGICYLGCSQGSIGNMSVNSFLSSSSTVQVNPSTTSQDVQVDLSGYEGNGYLVALHFGEDTNIAYIHQLTVTGPVDWSTPEMVTETTYTFNDLEPGTAMQVRVQAVCDAENLDNLSSPARVSFITPMCEPENMCAISYTLGVTNSQYLSWNGATIKVIHHDTGKVVGELTYTDGAANTGELSLCNGETYDFIFNNPQYNSYATFTFTAPDGYVIAKFTSSSGRRGQFAQYTMDCDALKIPQNLTVSELTTTTATLAWKAGGDETQWAVSYKDINAESETIIDEDFEELTSLPENWKIYTSVGNGSVSPVTNPSWSIVDGELVYNGQNEILFIPVELGGKAKLKVRCSDDHSYVSIGCYQGSPENVGQMFISENDYIYARLSTTPQEVEFDMSHREGNGYLIVNYYDNDGGDIACILEQLTVTKAVWSEPEMVEVPTYTIEGLEPEANVQVRVQAVSGEDKSRPASVKFKMPYCDPENQCEISYTLGMSDSQFNNWYGATIKVVHSSTGAVAGELKYSSTEANTGYLNLCIGETYDFVFVNPEGFPFITYTIRDSEGTVITSCTSSPEEGLITQYTVNCNLCKTPKNLTASELSTTSATVTWKAGGDETQWAVSYRDINAEGEAIIDEDFEELTSLPDGWEIYSFNPSNGNFIPSSDEDWTLANGELTTDESRSTLVIPVEFGGKARVTLDGSNLCILLSYQGDLANFNMTQLSTSSLVQCNLSTTPQEFVLDMSDYDGNGYLMVMNMSGTTNLGQLSVTGRGAWSDPVLVNEPEYTLEGLEPGTYASLRVQAACSEDDLSSPAYISFIIPSCDPQYQCAISYELGVASSQYPSWLGASIQVVNQSSGILAGKLEYTQGAENTGELFLCNGETYDFVFDNPAGLPFASFTIYDPNGNVIVTEVDIPNNGSGSMMGEELYVHSCGYDFAIINDAKNNSEVINKNHNLYRTILLKDRKLYKDGYWNTLCLPFKVVLEGSPLAGAEVRELESTNISGTLLTLMFSDPVNTIEAGKPYIIRWDKDKNDETIENPLFENVQVNATANNYSDENHVSFLGIYDAIVFDGEDFTEDRSILFMGAENTLYYPLKGVSLNACLAYFKIDDSTGNARQFVLKFGNDTPTGIATVTDDTKDEWYDLSGRRVRRAPAKGGVYVTTSGRKVVVK